MDYNVICEDTGGKEVKLTYKVGDSKETVTGMARITDYGIYVIASNELDAYKIAYNYRNQKNRIEKTAKGEYAIVVYKK